MHTPTFIIALFTIANRWKQPKCPLTDEFMHKMKHVDTMVWLHLEKEAHSDTGYNMGEPEDNMLSEIRRPQKYRHCMIPLI